MADKTYDTDIIEFKFADIKIPDLKERYGQDWVQFGESDKWPDFVEEMYEKSGKHAAIINGKINYIFGKGLIAKTNTALSDKFIDEITSVVKAINFDIENSGGAYLQIIPNLLGTYYHIYHVPFKKIRSNNKNTMFYYKDSWTDKSLRLEPPKPFKAFEPSLRESSIYCFKENTAKVYAFPKWLAGVNWIASDIEVSRHTLSNAITGFSATKLVTFKNGSPDVEGKREITQQFRGDNSGSNGEKIIIQFNKPGEEAATVEDLGASALTKEDFTAVDNLITSNIFAVHSVTHPLLFGIQQAGKLGGGSELRTAYDIFKSTYVNAKQQQIEEIINIFAALNNIGTDFNLVPVDPIGLDFSYELLLQAAPRSWILEKLGIDAKLYPDDPIGQKTDPSLLKPIKPQAVAPVEEMAKDKVAVNDNIKNLTTKQHQQLLRIIRQYSKGIITRQTATVLLKTGLGLSDEDIKQILGEETQQFSIARFKTNAFVQQLYFESSMIADNDDETFSDDESVAMVFAAFGESKAGYESVLNKKASFASDEDAQLIPEAEKTISILDKIKRNIPKFEVRYGYEKRSDASGANILPTTRPFCRKLIGLDKFYTRVDIQKISQVLGYDVFLRTGGFWNNKGTIEYHCRHEFRSHVVVRKKV